VVQATVTAAEITGRPAAWGTRPEVTMVMVAVQAHPAAAPLVRRLGPVTPRAPRPRVAAILLARPRVADILLARPRVAAIPLSRPRVAEIRVGAAPAITAIRPAAVPAATDIRAVAAVRAMAAPGMVAPATKLS
jgi:hypothetical protein